MHNNQFSFQNAHAHGRVVNLGSHIDGGKLKINKGAVNVDLFSVDPYTKEKLPVDVVADVRKLPFDDNSFDCAVLGDILEHMELKDILKTLEEAKRVVADGGTIVITCPNDKRPLEKKLGGREPADFTEGITAYHKHPVDKTDMLEWIDKAKLEFKLSEFIEYQPWNVPDGGTGVVAVVHKPKVKEVKKEEPVKETPKKEAVKEVSKEPVKAEQKPKKEVKKEENGK